MAGNAVAPALPLRGCGGWAVDLGYTLSVMAVRLGLVWGEGKWENSERQEGEKGRENGERERERERGGGELSGRKGMCK